MRGKECASTGKLVFVDRDGNMETVRGNAGSDIVSLYIVSRGDIAGQLKEMGFEGTDREVCILLERGLARALDAGMYGAEDIIRDAIHAADEDKDLSRRDS